ncbi:FAD-dependent oxidoreductase [Pedobacter africanus]|uniref:Ribulose 1,5-bisphosphate synthetase/thiazole synthase n=1 Tax=Pedobacter africanus TaxID=151894 RepID=A0ACC6KU06_9SPHI|nr:FAD-dependent oxidoreductase [Pedobacter africanus]MDR6782598.1 ribulose 1,5-bisphosphate synthetase/thiazole synthase [Pedobacter africanus]
MKSYLLNTLLFVTVLLVKPVYAQQPLRPEYDICVYGGTSSGVIAAYTAAKLGKSVLLIEPGKNLGGMSSGGLGLTDIGNKYAISGLALDFYRRIGLHYGKFEQWIFEPHVAENLFLDYIKRAKVEVLYENRLTGLTKNGKLITEITLENTRNARPGKRIRAKMFIDCSYEGDLMAKAGVSYVVGREANEQYKETFNGVQLMTGHQLPDGIDPYKTPGDASSGLLWGIQPGVLEKDGSGDKKVQAYNFRICLTNNKNNLVPITKPENYQPERYELLLRQMGKRPWKSLQDGFIWSGMPNGKTDINNRNGFSTDMIGMNWEYPDASYKRRAEIWKAHVDYTKGLLYFVGNDPRVAEHIRAEIKQWGYPKDEYTSNGNWSHQLYIREARRMVGSLVMTQHHCQGKELVNDGVGTAAYTMDSHNCNRLVVNGMVKNEGNVEEGGFGPYPISYRAIVPKANEVSNLLVPVCLSASHIAYGSIRMEPVFMVLGQSAAVAAAQAIDQKQTVQQVDVAGVQAKLKNNPLVDGSIPEILVDNNDPLKVQKTGSWEVQLRGGYGPDYYLSEEGQSGGKIKYIPEVHTAGKYEIFTYYPKQKNGAAVTQVNVYDGKKTKEILIADEEVKVLGQTSGEWISLGLYKLGTGKQAYIEIANKGNNGRVVADAILLVPR